MTRDRIHFEVALLVSVLLHVSACEIVQHPELVARIARRTPLAKLFGTWKSRPATLSVTAARESEIQTMTFVEAPRTFMETTAEQVTDKEPADAEFYSDKATIAANIENPAGKIGDTPYLEGKETRMASAADVMPFTGAAGLPVPPLPPVVAAPIQSVEAPPTPTESVLPQPAVETGLKAAGEKDIAMSVLPSDAVPLEPSSIAPPKPAAVAAPAVPVVSLPERPPLATGATSGYEIAAMKSRLTASGVARIGAESFNVAGSPFGAYDEKIIKAVQSRWYALIEKYAIYERSGMVTISFELREDGTVQDLQQKENSVGELLASFCEKAILDSTPFEPFPDRLQLLLGHRPREGIFTFYY